MINGTRQPSQISQAFSSGGHVPVLLNLSFPQPLLFEATLERTIMVTTRRQSGALAKTEVSKALAQNASDDGGDASDFSEEEVDYKRMLSVVRLEVFY